MIDPAQLRLVSCGQCGVNFGLAAESAIELENSGDVFCCPYGHDQRFSRGTPEQDEVAGLRKELARQKGIAGNLWRKSERLQEEADAWRERYMALIATISSTAARRLMQSEGE